MKCLSTKGQSFFRGGVVVFVTEHCGVVAFFEAIYVIRRRWKDSAIVAGNVVAVVVSACSHMFRYILKKGLKDIPLDLCLCAEQTKRRGQRTERRKTKRRGQKAESSLCSLHSLHSL